MQIRETIVVEGKDDESAVKQAVKAEIIITHGFGISEATFQTIEWAQKKNGIIIFTDPDTVGEQIRNRINNRIKGCKNAFLTKAEARKKDNIGIENANPESIIDALKKAKCIETTIKNIFTIEDLRANKLMGAPDAAQRRQELGKILRIGYSNAKQLLNRLNHYNISKSEFNQAIKKL
ncbi:MAG: ribonuclease M5 [Desulfobacteraceae bacterium]|nr:ribonuclease M5 [Desulfobacteraceae bacterium]